MTAQRAWLIDASIYIFRAWFSLPDQWHSPDGRPLNAVLGYTRFLLDFLHEAKAPTVCAAAFDESLGTNYRNDFYPNYKCSRELPDDDLAFQLAACRQLTELLGIPCYGGSRFEADDYIAALAKLCHGLAMPVTVVTRDKDLGQVLRGSQDNWWDFAAGELIDAPGFEQRFGVRPDQFADYLALVGDPVDDIPGVPGIGRKTAAALLQAFGDLDSLGQGLGGLNALSIRGAARATGALQAHWGQALMSRQLALLASDIADITEIPRAQLTGDSVAAMSTYLAELGIDRPLLRRCEQLSDRLAAA